MASYGGAYNAGTAHVNIKPRLANFANELRADLQRVNVDHEVNVTADTTSFASQVRAAVATLPKDHRVNISADVDSAQARTQLNTLARDRKASINAEADTARAAAELEVLSRDRTTNIDVQTSAEAARREINRLTGNRRTRITVEADTSGAQRAIITLGNRIRGLDRYQRHIALTAAGFTALGTAAAGAIGPISALVAAVGRASGALATLPAIAGGALAGIAGLGVGLSGVGGAFTAMGQSAQGGGSAAEDAMESAHRAAEKAQRGVERAHRAVEDAERGIVRAQRNIRDAERDLAQAQERSRDAQQDLNRARQDAVDDLRDMNEQLQDAALDEEGAVLAVARAQQRLQQTMMDPDSDHLDRAEADLAYRKSIDRLQDIREANNELAADVAEANRRGVEGSEKVIEANERLEQAQWDEMKAAEGVEYAHQGLADAHQDLADAQQGVIDAQRDLADALADVGATAAEAAAGGLDPFAEAMSKISPEAREFVLAIRELGDEWRALRFATQDALFDGMAESVTSLARRQLPVLQDGLVGINTEINRGLRTSMAEFATEVAALDFEAFLTNTARGFGGLADAARPMSRIWMDLATVGSEYLPRMGDAIADTMNKWSASLITARHSGRLNEIIDNGIQSTKDLMSVIGDLGGIVAGTFRAARSSVDPFVDSIRDGISATHEWVDSMEGQAAMDSFFTETTTAVASALPPLQAFGELLATGLVPIVEAFVTGVGPGLTDFIERMTKNMHMTEPAIGAFGSALGGVLSDVAGFVDLAEPLLSVVVGLVEGFLDLPQPLLTAIAALGVAKWTKFSGVVEGASVKVKGFSDELRAQKVAADDAGQGISTIAAGWRALETRSATATRMGQAFQDYSRDARLAGELTRGVGTEIGGVSGAMRRAQGSMQTFGGVLQGSVAAGLTGAMSGARGLIGALGGPWMLALAGATTAVAAGMEAVDNSKMVLENMEDAATRAADANERLFDTLLDGGSVSQQAEADMSALRDEIQETAGGMDGLGGAMQRMALAASENSFGLIGIEGDLVRTSREVRQATDDAKAAEEVMGDLGLTTADLAAAVSGSDADFANFTARLREQGRGGEYLAGELEKVRAGYEQAKAVMEQLSPEAAEAERIFRELAETTGDAADRADKLRYAYMELRGVNISSQEAAANLTEEVARVNEEVRRAAEGTNEFAGALVDAEGNIDTTTSAGAALWGELDSIGSTLQRSVASGNDATESFEQMYPALEGLRTAANVGRDEWDAMLESLGMTPEQLTITAELAGASTIEQKLGGLRESFRDFEGEPITTEMVIDDEDARRDLEELGFKVDLLDEETGVVNVTMDDEWASQRLKWWLEEGMPALDQFDPEAKLYLDDDEFMLSVEAAKFQLMTLDSDRPNPLASMDISQLSQSAIDALNEVGLLDGQRPEPEAFMNISKLSDEQKIALSQVFDLDAEEPTPIADLHTDPFSRAKDWAHNEIDKLEEERPTVVMDADTEPLWEKLQDAWRWVTDWVRRVKDAMSFGDNSSDDASGDAPGYSTGGRLDRHNGYRLPTTGPGTNVTDGFLGLDSRGMPIARVDAGEWIINADSSRKYHSELAAINAGTFPKLGGGQRVDNIPAHSTGGVANLPAFAVGGIAPARGGTVQHIVEGVTPLQQAMWDTIRYAFPNAQLSSAYRSASGPYHGTGQAIDLGGGWANDLGAIARWIGTHFPHSTELFWDPGPNIKNGRPTGAIGGHSDHVHWALTSMDMLNPMGSMPAVDRGPDLMLDVISAGNRPTPYSPADWGVTGGGYNSGAYRKSVGNNATITSPAAGVPGDDYGLYDANLDGVGGAIGPLEELRTSGRGSPSNYSYDIDLGGRSGRRSDDLPTTWGELAVHVATPFIKGQIQDALGVLGAPSTLPPVVDAYFMFQQERQRLEYAKAAQAAYLAQGNAQLAGGAYSMSVGNNAGTGASDREFTYNGESYFPDLLPTDSSGTFDPLGFVQAHAAHAEASMLGYDPSQGAEQWRGAARTALRRMGYSPDAHDDVTVQQIDIESGGDPEAVNNWDINAANGDPSVGLLQVIGATYRNMRSLFPQAFEGLPDSRTHPLTNLVAGIAWTKHRYNGPSSIWPTRAGYKDGGDVWGPGGPRDDAIPAWLSNGEHVTQYASAAVARPLLNAMNDNPALAAQLNQSYLAARNAPQPAPVRPVELHYHIETNTVEEGMRRAQMGARRQVMSLTR